MSSKTLSELFDLHGKTAVVTGGSMGIGYAIVQRLAEAGANVVIADISEIGREKAAALGQQVAFAKTDVSDEASVKAMIKTTIDTFGGLDIFVNNAGIYPTVPTLSMDLATWEKIQAINLRGVFLCCREAGKVMLEKKSGTIINVASIDALHPSSAGLAAYDASKHGVWGFTKSFALELGSVGIRVNAIAPGGITTEGTKKSTEQYANSGIDMGAMMKEFAAKIPLGRMGEPDDIGSVALFLASDAARYMTGSMVVVDGGVLLK